MKTIQIVLDNGFYTQRIRRHGGRSGIVPPWPSEVLLNEEDGMKAQCAVNLHNVVTVSQR
jgi:hypothetical protein